MEYVRVEIASLSLVPSGGGTCAIVLREADGERFLPVVIGLLEAQAIAVKLQGMPTPRPLTHDLLGALLSALHGRLVRVTVDNVREGTFFATIEVEYEGSVIKIDARPSDAIALAVRLSAPVFVADAVMDAAGASPESLPQIPVKPGQVVEAPSAAPRAAATRVEELEAQMQDAIREENYERAAQIRDELGRIRTGGAQ
jgi:bifunctional DNase/RNase